MLSFYSFILNGQNKEKILNTVSFFGVRSRTSFYEKIDHIIALKTGTTYLKGPIPQLRPKHLIFIEIK